MQEAAATPPSFFIAEKLRGIPLVTAGRSQQQPQQVRRRLERLPEVVVVASTSTSTTTRRPASTTTTTSRPLTSAPPRTSTRKPAAAASRLKPVHLEPSKPPTPVGRLGKLLRTAALEPTRPDNGAAVDLQRRAPGPALPGPTRFTTSRPASDKAAAGSQVSASSGGRNWHLFNSSSSGAGLAPFEAIALATNLLIAATVILIILMNWVKSLRCGRKQTAAKQVSAPPAVSLRKPPKAGSRGAPSIGEASPKEPSPSSVSRSPAGSRLSESGVSSLVAKSPGAGIDKQLSSKQPSANNQPPTGNRPGGMAIRQPSDTVSSMKRELEQAGLDLHGPRAAGAAASSVEPPAPRPINNTKMEDTKKEKEPLAPRPLSEPLKTSEPAQKVAADGRQSVGSLESVELPAALVGGAGAGSSGQDGSHDNTAGQGPRENLLLTLKQAEVAAEEKASCVVAEGSAENNARPENPMSEHLAPEAEAAQEISAPLAKAAGSELAKRPIVVNKLDKRKTELEIVDLRDSSVAGKIQAGEAGTSGAGPAPEPTGTLAASHKEGWISMDEVAVVQPSAAPGQTSGARNSATLTPADIIESRFKVDYKEKPALKAANSFDSRRELEATLEADAEPESSRTKNKKYFVYIVQDGHFSARKECIAQIELPSKKRVTLAEMRTLIANSQDISLASLRRNKFKFVTETYRLLNENEDATVLHQVYPTQGVFLKLNIAEQETLGHLRTVAAAGPGAKGRSTGLLRIQPSGNTTGADATGPGTARRRSKGDPSGGGGAGARGSTTRPARSTGRRGPQAPVSRSKSSFEGRSGVRRSVPEVVEPLEADAEAEEAQVIGRSMSRLSGGQSRGSSPQSGRNTATSIGANMMSGAKRLFDATFNRQSQDLGDGAFGGGESESGGGTGATDEAEPALGDTKADN